MRRVIRGFAPTAWLRLPRRTARLRLTLLYAGLFLLLGTGLLGLTFVLFGSSGPISVTVGPVNQVFRQFTRAPGGPPPALRAQAPVTAPKRLLGARTSKTRALRNTGGGFQRASIVAPNGPPVPAPGLAQAVVKGIRGKVVAQQDTDIDRLLEYSWLGLALTALAAGGLGWVAADRVLRPLRAITSTARTISAGNLHQRLALDGAEDEFKQLGDTLDDLLARLEGSFEAQRRFVANASHELRTPLTLERALLQVALADPDATAETLRSACEELLASQSEHEQLLEALLTLASSERGLERREPLDLSALTERALQGARPEIQRLGLELEVGLEPAPATGEPALIQRLITNLIDNAVDHNVAEGRLTVRTESQAGQALFAISNTGPRIAPDQTERLFEPFQRLDVARTGGHAHHGLGLSIVRAIATAHDATLNVESRPDGGLTVTVCLGTPIPPN